MMLDVCEEIYPAVLKSTMHGDDALRQLNDADTPFVYKVYGPKRQGQNGK